MVADSAFPGLRPRKPYLVSTCFGQARDDRSFDAIGVGSARAAVHEYYTRESGDASATAFALLMAAQGACEDRRVIWIGDRRGDAFTGRPYGPGLVELGIDPARFTLVRLNGIPALLRAATDSVRGGASGIVMLELRGRASEYDLTASRRLALAAERSDTVVLIARNGAEPSASAAYSRWRVMSAPSAALAANAPGAPAFDLELLRHRGGLQGLSFRLYWNRDEACFDTSLSGARPAESGDESHRPVGRRIA